MKVLTAKPKTNFGTMTTPLHTVSTLVLIALRKFQLGTTPKHAVSTLVLTTLRKFQLGTTHVLTAMTSDTNLCPPGLVGSEQIFRLFCTNT